MNTRRLYLLPTITLIVAVYVAAMAIYIVRYLVDDFGLINETPDNDTYFLRRAILLGSLAILLFIVAAGQTPESDGQRRFRWWSYEINTEFWPWFYRSRLRWPLSLGCVLLVACVCFVTTFMFAGWGLRDHWRTASSSVSSDGRFEAVWVEEVPFGVVWGSGYPDESVVLLLDRDRDRRLFPWPRDNSVVVFIGDGDTDELNWSRERELEIIETTAMQQDAVGLVRAAWCGVQIRTVPLEAETGLH